MARLPGGPRVSRARDCDASVWLLNQSIVSEAPCRGMEQVTVPAVDDIRRHGNGKARQGTPIGSGLRLNVNERGKTP